LIISTTYWCDVRLFSATYDARRATRNARPPDAFALQSVKFISEQMLLACPFFSPTNRADDIALPHPARLPLGAAWRGTCTVQGHETAELGAAELECCNLGYAHTCPRLPEERHADAVRFIVSKQSPERIIVQYVLETNHLPVGHGMLEYDREQYVWKTQHSEPRIQSLADCYLRSYLERNRA
jgi:hypothetical protein